MKMIGEHKKDNKYIYHKYIFSDVKYRLSQIKLYGSGVASAKFLRIFIVCMCCFFTLRAGAMAAPDSLRFKENMVYVTTGTALVAGGLLAHLADHHYAQKQDVFLPRHYSKLDDIGRWIPEMVRIGLHLGGIESRSDWVRTVNSRMFAYGLNLGMTEGLKRIIRQKRPDGNDTKSTPSGHAAMAFMSAAVLDEEFGYVSPLITLGGYAVSTAIAYDRTRGNHHYAGDVILGSGIGLLAAKAGYLLCDKILKGRGKRTMSGDGETATLSMHPSFLGIYGGYGLALNHVEASGGTTMKQLGALQVGLEGAWFPSTHVGFGGRVTEGRWLLEQSGQDVAGFIDRLSAMGGLYASFPLSSSAYVGGKLLGGYSVQTGGRKEVRQLGLNTLEGATFGSGVLAGYTFRRNLDLRFQLDYDMVCGKQVTLHYLCPAIGLNFFF